MALRLLDLFSGAGGAAMGYHRAGFEVVGVDVKYQPRYPFKFFQRDAIGFLMGLVNDTDCAGGYRLSDFDAIHASPPCQAYTVLRHRHPEVVYPDMVATTRELLITAGLPWIIENVPGAPLMPGSVMLCGTMFGLRGGRIMRRGGHPDWRKEEGQQAMGIDWMTMKELSQALPPAYTEYIGRQLLAALTKQRSGNV